MKIKIIDSEKIVLYLYNYFFKNLEKESIKTEIKNIFLKLIQKYQIKISGIYDVLVYENLKYGTVLEINKKEELLFHQDLIDIKVKIIIDCNVYLKTTDYFILEKYNNVYYKDSFYYINILDIDNILSLIEYVDIIYDKDENYLDKMILIN